MEKRAGIVNSY